MILLLTSEDYYQADRVREQLDKLGRDSLSIDFNGHHELSYTLADGVFSLSFKDQVLDNVSLIWRSTKFLYPDFGDTAEWAETHIRGNTQRENYLNFLMSYSARICNPISCIRLGAYKLLQLKLAHAAGFRVPPTIVTNSPEKIRAWRQHGKSLIVKCIGSSSIPWIEEGVKQRNIPTCKLDEEYLENCGSDIEGFQAYVQENIKKRFEHRTVYVAGTIFNFRVDPSQHPIMETDYRSGGMMVEYLPYQLPKQIEERVKNFSMENNLFSACFDFIEDFRGEFYFLEVNPEGVWGKHDDILEGSISACFAKALIDEVYRDKKNDSLF